MAVLGAWVSPGHGFVVGGVGGLELAGSLALAPRGSLELAGSLEPKGTMLAEGGADAAARASDAPARCAHAVREWLSTTVTAHAGGGCRERGVVGA